MSYKPFIEQAIEKSSHKPVRVLIWQREQLVWDPINEENGERDWQKLVRSARDRKVKAEAVAVNSDDGLYIIYTSGKLSCFSHRRVVMTPSWISICRFCFSRGDV